MGVDMSLLSDDEIEEISHGKVGSTRFQYVRAAEAAILAKLASAELPEPDCLLSANRYGISPDAYPVYTADQLRQAFAQGAASQLSAEPVAARVWVGSYEGADHENQYVYSEDGDGEPLFTLKEPK